MICKRQILNLTCFGLLAVFASGCGNEESNKVDIEGYQKRSDSLSLELQDQQRQYDSLHDLIRENASTSGMQVYFGKSFDTISDPVSYISEALRQKKDLIPLEGVLGGTMEFRQIEVITEQWVLALYDDGHHQGKSIFEYELQPGGEIVFKEIASSQP